MPTDPQTQDATTPRWAVVELMGHIRTAGRVSKDTEFGTAMLRLDVPINDTEFATQYINPSSLYRMTMAEESLARAVAAQARKAPVEQWEVRHLLSASSPPSQDVGDDEDEDVPL